MAFLMEVLALYIKEVNNFPLLTPEEEMMFARLVAEGHDHARERMIESNLRLVIDIAKKFLNRGLYIMDLISEGNLGLMKAVEKFDHERGYKFSTYATWWIRQKMQRAIINQKRSVRVPWQSLHIITKAREVQAGFEHTMGLEEIVDKLDVPEKRHKFIKSWLGRFLEMEQQNLGDLSDILPADPDNTRVDHEYHMLIEWVTQNLSEVVQAHEYEALLLRWEITDGCKWKLEDIGKIYGVSKETVRLWEVKAKKRLTSRARTAGLF